MIVKDKKELRQTCKPIEISTCKEEIDDIVKKLLEELDKDGEAVGLAAPQIGIKKQVFAVRLPWYEKPKFFVNPELLVINDSPILFNEGCLSFPGLTIKTKRDLMIYVSYWDENFKVRAEYFGSHYPDFSNEGIQKTIENIVIQHEFDHLRGILFMDRRFEEND